MESDLARAWLTAEAAMPEGWRLVALVHAEVARMAAGLHPALEEDLRTIDTDIESEEGWVALAAAAASDWVVAAGSYPAEALRNLVGKLESRAGGPDTPIH
jgi:hypothetical protein